MEEKLRISYDEKGKGNQLFKEGKFEEAQVCYSKALLGVNSVIKEISEDGAITLVKDIQIPCLLNLSACFLSVGSNFESVIVHCSDVLRIDKHNAKAYYRRAQAHFYLKNYKDALNDIGSARTIDPQNKQLASFNKIVRETVLRNNESKKKKNTKKEVFIPTKTIIAKRLLFCCKRRRLS